MSKWIKLKADRYTAINLNCLQSIHYKEPDTNLPNNVHAVIYTSSIPDEGFWHEIYDTAEEAMTRIELLYENHLRC